MIATTHLTGNPPPIANLGALSAVFSQGSMIRLTNNELLYMPEEESTHVYLVVSGEIRLYNINPEGREFTFGLYGAGEIVGECELLNGSCRASYAMARGDTTVLSLDQMRFFRELKDSPESALLITRFISRKNQSVERKMESLLFKSAHAKVAEQLLALADQHGRAQGSPGGEQLVDIAYPITHQEIANLIGATRETVSYVLLDFKAMEMILTSRRHITVRNLAGLKDIAAA